MQYCDSRPLPLFGECGVRSWPVSRHDEETGVADVCGLLAKSRADDFLAGAALPLALDAGLDCRQAASEAVAKARARVAED